MLAVALVLTTLVVPMAVSATTDSVDIVMTPSATAVKNGETFTVTVSAKATGEEATAVNVDAMAVYVDFPSTAFEFVSAEPEQGEIKNATLAGTSATVLEYLYTSENDSLSVTPEGVELYTVTFKAVADVAEGSYEMKLSTARAQECIGLSDAGAADVTAYSVTSNGTSVPIEKNIAIAKINNAEIQNNKTYINADGIDVTVEQTNATSVTLKKDSGEAEELLTEGAVDTSKLTALEAGTYVLTITTPGNTATYTFTVSTTVVSGQLEIVAPENKVVAPGDTVAFDVKVSDLGEATAALISFDVAYDANVLELTASDGVEVGDNGTATVTYGDVDNNTGITGEGTVVTLNFTVKTPQTYDTTEVTISNEQLVLVKDYLTGDNDTCTITTSTAKVVVIPEEGTDWATVTPATTEWSKEAVTVTVSEVVSGAEVKYVVKNDGTTVTDADAVWDSAEELTENAFTVNDEAGTYYVIAKIGDDPAAYTIVDTLVNGEDVKYDGTAPVVADNNLDMAEGEWISVASEAYTINVDLATNLNVTERFKDGLTYKYAVAEGEKANLTDSIVIPVGTTEGENVTVTIYVTDEAGNEGTTVVTVNIDNTVPEVSIENGGQASGKVTLTVESSDTLSGIDSTKVYYSQEALDEATITEVEKLNVIEADEGAYTTENSGTYYAVAYDKAGNYSIDSVEITVADSVTLPSLTVKTKNDENAVAGTFKDAVTLTNQIGVDTNGTFTYVSIAVGESPDGTVALTLNGETVEADALAAMTAAGDYVLEVTATSKTDSSITKSATYKFSIVDAQANMVSPDGNNTYTMMDYAKIRNVLQIEGAGLNNLKTVHNFNAYLAGDVDADLDMDAADYANIITAIESGKTVGYYTFDVLNALKYAAE